MLTKRLAAAACLALSANLASAQAITLTNTGYSALGSDTTRYITNLTSFATYGTPATNGTWDLNTVTYEANDYYRFRIAPGAGSPWPAADNRFLTFYSFSNLSYSVNMYTDFANTGITYVGSDKQVEQALSISAVSGGPNDSLIFPVQTINQTAPRNVLPFPATMGTTWSSDFRANTQFQLSVAAYFMDHTPGERRSHTVETDSVVGWGKMRVKSAATGQLSGWMDVLQVHAHTMVIDSFYLNGSVAPDPLVSAFGLTQGDTVHYYRTRFFRAGEESPQMEIEFPNANHSGTPDDAFVLQSRLPQASASVASLLPQAALRVYPNPATDGVLRIEAANGLSLEGTPYVLYNGMGMRVAQGAVTGNSAAIGRNLPAGNYYLHLSAIAAVPVTIAE